MGIVLHVGMRVEFQDEGEGVITKVNEDSIFIESAFFTGWMFKAEFWELWGVED